MAFMPPFCPYGGCDNHHLDDPRDQDQREPQAAVIRARERWWLRRGSFATAHSGPVARYCCRSCGRTFSSRTFSAHFATHRYVDLRRLAARINGGGGVRGIARELGCSPKVVLNRIGRLARGALGVHSDLRASSATLGEQLVADGFESFVGSQYWPAEFTILVGAHSQYLYSLDYAQLRRKGRMSPAQRRRRDALVERDVIAGAQVRRSFSRILDEMQRLWYEPSQRRSGTTQLVLSTDRHNSYTRAIAADAQLCGLGAQGVFIHRQVDSRAPRTVSNPLFSANYFDREIRKDISAHVRQSVQFARSVNNAMQRLWLYAVWHNCFKARRINGADHSTHAEHIGLSAQLLQPVRTRMFSRRYFLSRMSFSASQWRTWVGGWAAPLLQTTAQRLPAYVLA